VFLPDTDAPAPMIMTMCLTGTPRNLLPPRNSRLLRRHRMGRNPALVYRQSRAVWHLLLRDQSVARGCAATTPLGRDLPVGRRPRQLPRHDPRRRHSQQRVLRTVVSHSGAVQPARPWRQRAPQPVDRSTGHRHRNPHRRRARRPLSLSPYSAQTSAATGRERDWFADAASR
jgi:hypothetical protein